MENSTRQCLSLVVLLSVFFLGFASVALAQSAGTAGLTGTITDPTGAVVPGVTVTATNTDTNQARTATTGADGTYKFTLLPPGNYRLRFTAKGFKTEEVPSVMLNVTESPVVDRMLQVGEQTEQVTVQAAGEAIQTGSSTLGTVVSTQTVTSLPLVSRNYTQILGLSAGASVGVANATQFGKGTLDMAVNGNDPGMNNFQMDGVSIDNFANRGSSDDAYGIYTGIGIPNPDAIQEFKVQTSTYDASYGRNPGANVNVITKSGTNTWHGTAYEFLRNSDLNANDFFYNRDDPASKTTKQVLDQNQFGGVLGGPIVKNKLFIFGSYGGTRQRNGVAAQGLTSAYLPPIPAGSRNAPGFAAALAAENCPANHPGDSRFSSFVAGAPQLACNGSNVNPVALAMLQATNADGSYYIPGSGTNTYGTVEFSDPATYTENQYLTNADYLINNSNTVAARFFYTHDPQLQTLGGTPPGSPAPNPYSNTYGLIKLTSIVTNTFLNEARASVQRNLAAETSTEPSGTTPAALGMIPTIPTQTQPPIVAIAADGFSLFGALAKTAVDSQWQYSDQISWSHGKHTIRAGFEFERVQYNLAYPGLNRGQLIVGSFNDLLVGQLGNILGCVYCVRTGPSGDIHGYRMTDLSSFVQDDYKISSRLTLNLGLRWEFDGALSDKYGNLTNVWTSLLQTVPVPPTGPQATGASLAGWVVPSNYSKFYGAPPAGVFQNDRSDPLRDHPPLTDFGPRLGFAWQPTGNGKLVIRSGAGIFYDRVGIDRMYHGVEQSAPYAVTLDFGYPNTATLQNPFPGPPLGSFPERWANFATGVTSELSTPFQNEVTRTPLVRQYNFTLQYQFAPRWTLEAGYVGSSGINLTDYNHNYNTALLASPSDPINGVTTTTVGNVALRVPYLGYSPSGLNGTAFDGISTYNSLQVTVRKQLSHGFIMQAAYTWSKGLTDILGTTANSNDASNLAQQYGPSTYNRPQRLVVNYSYDLPLGHANGLAGKLTSGWTVSGVTTIQDGLPFTIIDSSGGSVFGTSATYPEGGLSRAQICPGMTYGNLATSGGVEARLGGNSGGPGYINTSALCNPIAVNPNGSLTTVAACPACATLFGNMGAEVMSGPGQFNWDVALLKSTHITESTLLQFRTEFFNAFNHAQFNPPNYGGSGGSVAGGVVTLPNVQASNFGQITSTSVNPRVIQFGLKFIF